MGVRERIRTYKGRYVCTNPDGNVRTFQQNDIIQHHQVLTLFMASNTVLTKRAPSPFLFPSYPNRQVSHKPSITAKPASQAPSLALSPDPRPKIGKSCKSVDFFKEWDSLQSTLWEALSCFGGSAVVGDLGGGRWMAPNPKLYDEMEEIFTA